jgi:hypothetical protein
MLKRRDCKGSDCKGEVRGKEVGNREQNVGIYKGLQVGVAERWPWFGSIF